MQEAKHGEAVQARVMKVMAQDRYGPAGDVLKMREVPVPEPGEGEVLVRVHSSSVNAMEWHLMNGKPYAMRAAFGVRPRHLVLGADVSGTVEMVGAGVTRFKPGDRVFGEIGAGAYAEYAVGAETKLALKPDEVGFAEAAAIGVAGLTALQGLRDVLEVRPGDKVLINGASGGVGTYAIQIAKGLGATVTAVCSTRNVDQARRLGADHVIDYSKEDLTSSAVKFNAFFDIAGNHTAGQCKALLSDGGRYVMVGGPKGDWLGPLPRLAGRMMSFAFGDKKMRSFVAASRAEDLEELGRLLASGDVVSVIEAHIPLAEIATSLEAQGQFHARAKTVVDVERAV